MKLRKFRNLPIRHKIENIEFVTQAIRAGEINQLSGTEAEFAQVMCDVFFGEYKKYNDVEKLDYLNSKFNFTEARDEYFGALRDRNIPKEQEEALKSKLDKSLDEYTEKKEKYREVYNNNPSEIDGRDMEDVLIPSSVPVQTAQAAESSGIQTGESSRQQVQDDEITQAPRTPRRVSPAASLTQAGANLGTAQEGYELQPTMTGLPASSPSPDRLPRPPRSTNPISDCLPCFGRSRRSDSRSGRPRSQGDRRTR